MLREAGEAGEAWREKEREREGERKRERDRERQDNIFQSAKSKADGA